MPTDSEYVSPHSPHEDFFQLQGRARHTDVSCPHCTNGSIELTSAGYTCDSCDVILGSQHIDVQQNEHTYERYNNSNKWRLRGAYNVHEWEGSYSFEELSDDNLLSRR